MANGFNPAGLWGPEARVFSQGVVQHDGKVIHITGQVAWNEHNEIIGPNDVRLQMRQCMANIKKVLSAVGGRLDDIVALTTFFTRRDDIPAIQEVRHEYFSVPSAPASNLIQVAGLVDPAFVIELVPQVVIPHDRFVASAGQG